MKRAVILHGTSAEAMSGWRPWLKLRLEAEGYDVWVPSLPDNDTPNRDTYNNLLFTSGWDFTDNILVGHSSGAVEVLNLLMDERCPRIKLGVAVSAWAGTLKNETPELKEQMSGIFPATGFDFDLIKQNAERLVFIHNEYDPYCSSDDAVSLSRQLEADLIMLHEAYGGNADHLGSPLTELPVLWDVIKSSLSNSK